MAVAVGPIRIPAASNIKIHIYLILLIAESNKIEKIFSQIPSIMHHSEADLKNLIIQ